ncbi:helix-turn-helix domain-containing protein [Shinella sp. HZN7]|uniref:helix-turn-helix domain-containing protein n=1 Tax=Shinella sp. (strain HZN7) TaxID=879274 RepID=UPI00143983FF|nr:helix-turn-helix domain-containing protein [Shinella sp. HZN7]
MDDVLTTAKAAQLLGVSVRTAQLWVESGQLPSWKTPGGHRRIPRQAVLDLIDNSAHEQSAVRAHAVILAGEGRAARWRTAGLPGSGLLVDVAEEIQIVKAWLAFIPPMLVVVENADEGERKRLVAALSNDVRFNRTLIISLKAAGAAGPVALAPRHVQFRMAADVAATSAAIVDYLSAHEQDESEPAAFPKPWSERARLEAVRQSGLVGSPPDAGFDRLVRLAAHATRAPIAMFTLITQAEQWFKSRVGFEGSDTPRDWAFCNETLVANELTVIEDLTKANKFAQNPTLAEPYGFRFYAGAPVRDPLGFALGSICVIDVVPRTLGKEDREALITIAEAASQRIHLMVLQREAAGFRA